MKNQMLIVVCLLAAKIVNADVLDTWIIRNSDPSYSLTGIGYGHGLYVATGNPGILLTSPDAINWTRRDLGTTTWLGDVAYGNGIFVVVGASGTIFSSPDGMSWTPRSSGITNDASFNRLRFLNGKFIAVGDGDTIDTSSDGINWTLQNSGLPPVTGNPHDPDNYLSHLYCVNYGNGLYIISGKSSTILLSYDAVNWFPETINSGCCLGDIIYGNGIFVLSAAFSGPGGIMTSADGFTWANQSALGGIGFGGMAFAQGFFVGAGGGGGSGKIFSSTDGTNWTQRALGISANFWNIKYLNGTFIAVGDSGTILQTSNTFGLPPAQLTLLQTNRTPKTAEIGQPTIPTDPNHFKVFTNGVFQSGIALDPNKMTVILTHGWKGSPSDWAEYTAQIIQQRIGANTVNLVAWDWHAEATNTLPVATQLTLGEGHQLGTDLSVALGAGYSQRIHFIGHSLGTLVNAAAANCLEANGYSGANIQMTLCDEAEIAWGTTSQAEALASLFALLNNSSTSQPFWNGPLPRQFNWADNYVSACGLLHPEAANVILTWEFPTSFPDFDTLETEFFNFHDFAHYFYEDTIEPSIYNTGGQTNATYAGFICSFEGGGIANRPAANTYFYQDPNGYELTLVQTNFSFATSFLNQRLGSYIGTIQSSGVSWALNTVGQAVGQVQGVIDYTGNLIINLFTTGGSSSPSPNGLVRPMGGPVPQGGSSGNNNPAYAWIPLFIPSNTVSMTFDFMLQGDGASDSFQAALNGTNVLSLETMLIQTNVTLNSGMIDVSAYAGQTNEFFVGIVGGTSTNAQLTVQNLVFYSAPAPLLQAQSSGNNPVLTWPISATGFNLQYTTNLADPNSWMTLSNVPAIVNLQNAITNSASGGVQFYRLKK